VKCDGRHPCIHCTVYSYECTYNHLRPTFAPAKRKKEEKKEEKEEKRAVVDEEKIPSLAMLKTMFPEVAMNDSFQADLFCEVFAKHKKDGQVDMNAVLREYNESIQRHTATPKQALPSNDHVEIRIILPPREIALKLIYKTWSESCVLFRFYHRPTFITDFNSLYEINPAEYSNHQNKILPLIYSVIAVGALFSKGDNAIDNQYLQDEGYRYFIAARKLIDITNTSDLESIQTIFMLTLFLQCSARLSTCYSYIGIALRSALRQGLHRKLETSCDNIKSECKKRLFWTIYKLEIYVNSILGLPHSIDESDIDAELPRDLDDVNIERDHIKPQQPGKLSSCGINNSHTKLILILNHIVKKLYKTSSPIYMISQEVFQSLENELKIWKYELPYQLQMDHTQIPPEYVKANRLLYLDYLHVQIMLYRPYINYVKLAKENHAEPGFRNFHYDNGIKCFQISKDIITLAQSMIDGKLLNGSYWFSIYTIFFSVACLVYYFLEIDNTDEEVKKSIEIGKKILSASKQRSMGAERIYNLLNHMFENYDRHNIRLQELQQQAPEHQKHSMASYGTTTIFPSGIARSNSPLNQFISPNNTPNVNTAATHTTESMDKNTAIPQNTDQFDLQLFSGFLPGYMLENPMKGEDILEMNHPLQESPMNSSSSKTEEHEFDWDRFIDKSDILSFDI
jgi:hypothetical protein